jgi:hypothetical protein
MEMEQTQCSKTSVIKHHMPGNNPEDYTQHLEHGENLKSRITSKQMGKHLLSLVTIASVGMSSWLGATFKLLVPKG